MLCVICTQPIPNLIGDNKVCQSCVTRIRLPGHVKEYTFNDVENLDNLHQKLFADLNLDGDSDYEAELNYLMEVKRASNLTKQNNCIQSLKPCGDGNMSKTELPGKLQKFNEFEMFQPKNGLHGTKSAILDTEFMPESSNVTLKKNERTDSYSNVLHTFIDSEKVIEKCPDLHCGNQSIRKTTNRRVAIKNSVISSIVSIKKPERNSSQLAEPTSIVCRALIRPLHKHSEPSPQFEKIHSVECHSSLVSKKEVSIYGYKNPFKCPVTTCKSIIPVSDLIKHFKLNHIRVPIVPIDPGRCINLFWEAKVDQFGLSQCLMLLLTTGKVKEYGYGQYKNYLPVAIMTTKVKYYDLLTDVKCDREEGHFYMIYATTMCTKDEQVYYTITAWNDRAGSNRVHIVNSGQSYSIREEQNAKMVFASGKAMILTREQINKLSNECNEMVKLQVVIH